MKRYSEYKDSGVKWIGEIPGHWDCRKLKTLLLSPLQYGANASGVPYSEHLPRYIRITDITLEGKLKLSDKLSLSYEDAAKYILKDKDILFARSGASVGKTFLYKKEYGLSAFAGYLIKAELGKELIPELLFYFTQSDIYESWKNGIFIQSTIQNIGADKYSQLQIAIPPLPEQEAIVTYLDTKVAKIDEYISIAEKKIAALEELKQTIIAEAVTRGIHKDVPMKDSGVKWIGMIPEHWKIMRLRFVCEFRNGYTPSKANPKFWENGTIPWFRMEDIRDSGRFLNEAKQYISKEAVKGDGLFEAGSFILATTATIGEHAMLIADSLANQQFTNLKIRKSLISKLSRNFFFYYLFVIDEYCKSTTRKATFPSVDMTDLKNIGVSIPPIEEQQEIVTYLDSKVANINQLCQAERSQIEKLKEYKQRLISDVVTGKVKVTND